MTTSSQLTDQYGLGAIDQISFAVADTEEAARRYESIFGPFQVVDVPAMDITYRGRPSSVTLKLGFGRSGALEVELVQVIDGDSPTKDHLLEHGEGFHHVRFPVSDLKATQAAMQAEGWTTTFAGDTAGVSFAYLEPPPGLVSTVIELIKFDDQGGAGTV
jgi:catechol 2,3-dioxygenase-like lactoylglutathione lyase family enzyme